MVAVARIKLIDAATAQGYMVLKRKGQAISSFTQGIVAR
jgi:hypothetical protein